MYSAGNMSDEFTAYRPVLMCSNTVV